LRPQLRAATGALIVAQQSGAKQQVKARACPAAVWRQRCAALRCAALRCLALHCAALCCAALRFITLRCTTLHCGGGCSESDLQTWPTRIATTECNAIYRMQRGSWLQR
jgi:hypothetical protein